LFFGLHPKNKKHFQFVPEHKGKAEKTVRPGKTEKAGKTVDRK